MKAIVQESYGSPHVLHVREVEKPQPAPGEVLIRVQATAVNDYDWSRVSGKPIIYRLMFGLRKPKTPIPGMELSGVVEACGEGVTCFQPGDRVLGDTSDHKFGTFAEYFAVNAKALRPLPDGVSFEQAAATPHASLLAYQGLCQVAHLKTGQKLLINGAGGGVGAFALGYARSLNCEVTGVDSRTKLDRMREWGFDSLLAYEECDFTRQGREYDVVIDARSTRLPWSYLRSLRPGGCYVTVGGDLLKLLLLVILNPFLKLLTKKRLRILALKANEGLEEVLKLADEGALSCPIDGPFPLEEASRAIERFGKSQHVGKIVVRVSSP